MNITASLKIVEDLFKAGVEEYVVCAGSRNAPLIEVLAQLKKSSRSPFKIFSHFDERSASFFALGRAKATGQPVAVITTSGTAVSETLSALIESEYHGARLVVVSADRPAQWRGTGAPQTIRQNQLLENYADSWDGGSDQIESLSQKIEQWKTNGRQNLHLNIQFDEPLLDHEVPLEVLTDQLISNGLSLKDKPSPSSILEWEGRAVLRWQHEQLQSAVGTVPLIVFSGLNECERKEVLDSLHSLDLSPFLIYAEGPSGLREVMGSRSLVSDESFVAECIKRKIITGVVKIGRTPTGRYWRDLENHPLPLIHCSPNGYKGLSYGEEVAFHPRALFQQLAQMSESIDTSEVRRIQQLDRALALKIEGALQQMNQSDVAFVRKMSESFEPQSFVYVGNSLPIRQWDLAAHRFWPMCVHANRGANGIDGQLASAIGEGWSSTYLNILLGDLTTLYDMNSLSWLHQNYSGEVRLYVMNNSGGQIFSRMYEQDLYINSHRIDFKGIAQAFGFEHFLWSDAGTESKSSARLKLIEIVPEPQQSFDFHRQIKLWAKEYGERLAHPLSEDLKKGSEE